MGESKSRGNGAQDGVQRNDDGVKVIHKIGAFLLAEVPLDRLVLLKKNARYMAPDKFKILVENIKRDGQLSSVPFVYRNEQGEMIVVSGNHRVKAAREAGLKRIVVEMNADVRSEEWARYIQLSHNALVGKDDLQILRQLYDEIKDPDLKFATGLADDILAEMPPVAPLAPVVEREFRAVVIVFSPNDLALVREVADKANAVGAALLGVAREKDWQTFVDAVATVSEKCDVVAMDVVFAILAKAVDASIEAGKVAPLCGASDAEAGNTDADGDK